MAEVKKGQHVWVKALARGPMMPDRRCNGPYGDKFAKDYKQQIQTAELVWRFKEPVNGIKRYVVRAEAWITDKELLKALLASHQGLCFGDPPESHDLSQAVAHGILTMDEVHQFAGPMFVEKTKAPVAQANTGANANDNKGRR